MKYQALRPHFFSVVGGWRGLGVGGGGVGHGVGWWLAGDGVGGVGVGEWVGGGVVGPHDTPHHGGHQMSSMLFFDNLVEKLNQIVKNNMGHHGGHQMPPVMSPIMGVSGGIMGASDTPVTPPCYFWAIW